MLLVVQAEPAEAVFSGDMSPRARSGDSDYADGIEAFERSDWPGVVAAMTKVIARRPHHDNAWARLGYAQRKQKKYFEALTAYNRALGLNPHNRAALEYLGEAYVELGRIDDAKQTLEKLRIECRRVEIAFSDGRFSSGCDEFIALEKAIGGHSKANP